MFFSPLHFFHSQHPVERGVLLWSIFVIVTSVLYVVFGINTMTALGAIAVMSALFFFGCSRCCEVGLHSGSPTSLWLPEQWIERVVLAYVLVVDTFLLLLLWSARTDDALQTPWYAAGIFFFVLFACASVGLFWIALRTSSRLTTIAIVLHTFLIYGVALIVFRYGYGYDPLIHQAAEEHIVRSGRILPLQPFYIGQYSVVTALHFVTRLPVWLLDRALLPMLASVSIPFVARYGLERGYDSTARAAQALGVLIALLPIPFLTFTVPYNLTVLYLLWWVLLLPCASTWTLGVIAVAATCTHPLLGVPLLIATAAHTFRRPLMVVLGMIGVAVSIPAMLGVYRVLHELPFVTTWAPWTVWRSAFSLFTLPYDLIDASWTLIIFYRWMQMLPWALVALGCVWVWQSRRHSLLLSLSVGLFGAMVVTRTMIDLPGIVPYEQMEFVLRLRETIPIVFLPLALVFLGQWIVRARAIGIMMAGAVLAVSWYATYPVVNAVSTRVGWNVSAVDFAAVAAIEGDADEEPFVVLTDRMLAAAAVRERGFGYTVQAADGRSVVRYALEPTSPLFAYADKLLYYGLSSEEVVALHQWFPKTRVYAAIHGYWYRRDVIAQELTTLGATRIAGPEEIDIFVLP